MASILNTLNIGYTGLTAAQVGINTTGHNVSNAETEGYTRERVETSAATPISTRLGHVGNGTEVQDVKRVFDNFVFDRYNSASADKEYSDTQRETLEQLSTYFPEIDGVGVKSDLSGYYDKWESLADNPDNDAVKMALAKQSESLASHIKDTQSQVLTLQHQANDQIATSIDEVNDVAKQLADLNVSIDNAETDGKYTANDLRDKRNVLERSLSRLIGAKVTQGQLQSNTQIDSHSNTRTGSYTVTVNGFNIVDGNSFHPLRLDKAGNKYGFYNISYERQDGTLLPMNEKISGGKVGALLSLRGGEIDKKSGMPIDGMLQKTASDLDAFSTGLIEGTNNLYAQSASEKKISNILQLNDSTPLVHSNLHIKQGSFDVIIYDIDGNEVAKRAINIDDSTSMADGDNSIKAQIKANKDDNGNNNATDDVDDYVSFDFNPSASGEKSLELYINSDKASKGYTFSIKDNFKDGSFDSGTNFAGAIGLGRYFDGKDARDIKLTDDLERNPSKIKAGYSSSGGDNRLALDMEQQQFEKYNFKVGSEEYNTTLYGMFDITSTYVGSSTNAAVTRNESVTTQFNAVELQYNSVSKVSIDEEMTNLIKYQTSYSASAKVITTVDKMMQTLLGIKQ